MKNAIKIYCGDALDVLPRIAPRSVHLAVTSPPYFHQRDYGITPTAWPRVRYQAITGSCQTNVPAMRVQLGHEPSPEAYVAHLVHIFRLARWALRDDGVLAVNIGDCYNSYRNKRGENYGKKSSPERRRATQVPAVPGVMVPGLTNKDRVGIPERFALAMQADGWIWRDTIIWRKECPNPRGLTDRTLDNWEPVYIFAKDERGYYADPQAVATRRAYEFRKNRLVVLDHPVQDDAWAYTVLPRAVWSYPNERQTLKHFACYPSALIADLIRLFCPPRVCAACAAGRKTHWQKKRIPTRPGTNNKGNAGEDRRDVERHVSVTRMAGVISTCDCKTGGVIPDRPAVVLDPLGGIGTTAKAAQRLGRDSIIIEKSSEYCRAAHVNLDGSTWTT